MISNFDHIVAKGSDKAMATAVASLQSAVDAGDCDAAFALGVIFLLGRGVDTDLERALSLFSRAVRAGVEDAVYFRDLAAEQLVRNLSFIGALDGDEMTDLLDAERIEFPPELTLVEGEI